MIVDCFRKGNAVAAVRRQGECRAVRLPDDAVVIEALRAIARVALGARFGRTHDLAAVIHAASNAVVSAQRWKRRHSAVLPAKPLAETGLVEYARLVAKIFQIRVGLLDLRESREFASGVLNRTEEGTVRPPECAEVGEAPGSPKRGVCAFASAQRRRARDPAPIVDAPGGGIFSAKSPEFKEGVLSKSCLSLGAGPCLGNVRLRHF